MAAFIIGLVGYGVAIVWVLCGFVSFIRFAEAPFLSHAERVYLIVTGAFFGFAVVLAIVTNWIIKVAL